MPCRSRSLLAYLPALFALACGASVPRQPPGAPPTPETVNKETPGGDAHDPEAAALLRQLEGNWGSRRDKDNQLVVPLVDRRNHKRVRFWAFDHFVGFRYGKDYHVINVVLLHDLPEGVDNDSRTCLRKVEKWGRPQLKAFEVKMGRSNEAEQQWQGKDVLVKTVDGYVDFGFQRREFSAAYAAYPAYPRTCLVFAVAVPWGEHKELAQKVRDRWVAEAVPLLRPLTEERPYRK